MFTIPFNINSRQKSTEIDRNRVKSPAGEAADGSGCSQIGLPRDNGIDFNRNESIFVDFCRFIAIILFLALALPVQAAKEQNVVFLFDCTTSMKGYNGAPNIWEKAKDNLHKVLDARPEGTRVTVIPFQDKALPAFTFESPNYKWEDLEKLLDSYVDTHTNTNLVGPWQQAQRYLDPACSNYLYLFTDGQHNSSSADDWHNELKQWCGKAVNTTGVLVELTDKARDPVTREIVDNCPDLYNIAKPEQIPSKQEIPSLLDLEIVASPNGQRCCLVTDIATDQQVTVKSQDPDFVIEVGKTHGTETPVTFRLAPGVDYDSLSQVRPQKFDIPTYSTCPGCQLVNPYLQASCDNNPSPKAALAGLDPDETDLGKCSWYDKFLWSDAAEPGRVEVNVEPWFNRAAVKEGTPFRYVIAGKDGFKGFKTYYNGQECPGNVFTVTPGDQGSRLEIEFLTSNPQDKYYFQVKPVGHNDPRQYNMRSKYNVDWNPLKTTLMWVGIALAALILLWYIVIQSQVYPPIKKVKSITITKPYYKKVKTKGAWEVSFTPKKKPQGLWSRIVKGRTVNHANAVYTTPIKFRASSRGITMSEGRSDWTIDPPTTIIRPRENYKLINKQTKDIIEITTT